jgi:hypothetical protein
MATAPLGKHPLTSGVPGIRRLPRLAAPTQVADYAALWNRFAAHAAPRGLGAQCACD